MKRLCEYFYWSDFKEKILKQMFPNAEHITLEKNGAYRFKVYVEDGDGALVFSSSKIANMWNRIDGCYTVYGIHCDNQGIWVVYEQAEII